MNKAIVPAVTAVLAIAVAGVWFAMRPATGDFAECSASSVAGGAIGGSFELVSETGVTVTDADVLTKPSLIYFGFTFCPDVCPLDTVRNADAVDLLKDRGIDVQPVFISVDPERDTPEVMADYTDLVHEDMLGLTGSPEQIKAAASAYKVYYKKQDTGDDYYLVDHSTHTYLVLPGHGFVEFFRRDASAEAVAETAACFVEAAS